MLTELKELLLENTHNSEFDMSEWQTCAIGLAMKDSRFQNLGLTVNMGDNYFCPQYKSALGYGAVARFFNISFDDAFFLFSKMSYNNAENITPEMVAERIDAYTNPKS